MSLALYYWSSNCVITIPAFLSRKLVPNMFEGAVLRGRGELRDAVDVLKWLVSIILCCRKGEFT